MTNTGNLFEFKFEYTFEGKTRGIDLQGQSFTECLGKAATILRAPIMDVEHLKTARWCPDDSEWVTVFDPFMGINEDNQC